MAYNIPLRIRNLIRKADTTNPYLIAAHLKINIRFVNTPSHINGFWKKILKRKFIFVNADLEEWQQKAVIAHELGHILLHPQYKYFCQNSRTYYCSQRHENEADTFAILLCQETLDIDKRYIERFLKDGWK